METELKELKIKCDMCEGEFSPEEVYDMYGEKGYDKLCVACQNSLDCETD